MHQENARHRWEKQIDTLMHDQSTTIDFKRRQEIFAEVEEVLADNAPVSLASPRMYYAHSRRMRGVVPSVVRPSVLWNADSLSVTGPR